MVFGDELHAEMTDCPRAGRRVGTACIRLCGRFWAPCKDEQLADWSARSCDASISGQIIPGHGRL